MGNVWKATDEVLDCPIAIKVVRRKDDDDDESAIPRFMREAKLSASVQHPSVVRVTDFGVHNETPFIAMELLEGESLADRIERFPRLTIGESIGIVLPILRGLAAAHEAGVIHRDIKPANIHLVNEVGDASVYPKLIDFGISFGTVDHSRISAVTTNGNIFGTPVYMSPEHARGLEADARSDLYSVGVMLYELLGRRLPFDNTNVAELMAAVIRDKPPPLHEVRGEVSPELSAVVMKSLAKDRMDRYQSAREMAAALAEAAGDVHSWNDWTGPVTLRHRALAPDADDVSTMAETIAPPPLSNKRVALGASLSLMFLVILSAAWWAGGDEPSVQADVDDGALSAVTTPNLATTLPSEERVGALTPAEPSQEALGQPEEDDAVEEVAETPAPTPMATTTMRTRATRVNRSGATSSRMTPTMEVRREFRTLDY